MSRYFTAAAITIIAATMSAVILGPPASAGEPMVLNIHQDAPILATIDIGNPGSSHGDMLAFEAAVTTENGTKGTLSGILITIDLPEGSEDVFEDRIGQLVFNLGASDSIVVAGKSIYAEEESEMNTNHPQLRAVIGGTGQFIGARGQVTTIRNSDGTYEHSFQLLD